MDSALTWRGGLGASVMLGDFQLPSITDARLKSPIDVWQMSQSLNGR